MVNEYVEQQSAKTGDREQFRHMFQAASQRRFDILPFWSLDRLSRKGVLETLQHLQRLTSYGVAWRSFTEQYLDSTGIFREAVIGTCGRSQTGTCAAVRTHSCRLGAGPALWREAWTASCESGRPLDSIVARSWEIVE
jgi:hypothetical protein